MKSFEPCPDIDTGGPRCILFEAVDDDENFYVDIYCEHGPIGNMQTCCCTRRLTPKELAEFPYYFKDVQLSEKGWERLHKAYEEFGDNPPSDADDNPEV